MDIQNIGIVTNLLAQNDLTLQALGLHNAKNLDIVKGHITPRFLESLSLVDKIVIASGFLIATSLLVLGALAIRAEVLSVKNGSFLTKITGKGGYSMIGTAAGIALLSILYLKFYSHPRKEPTPIKGQGLREGNTVLLFGDFDPAKHKGSDLFFVNQEKAELCHNGRITQLERVILGNLPPGMQITNYKAGGTTLFTCCTCEIMKMLLPPYYQANFAAIKGLR